MAYDCLIKLIKETAVRDENGDVITDDIGNPIVDESEEEVYAEIGKIGQTEFFQAARSGLKPQKMVRVWTQEYAGQLIVEVEGKRLNVYRTYESEADGKTEIYLERKAGTPDETVQG